MALGHVWAFRTLTTAPPVGRLEECNTLMELLKKFQGCRGYVSSTMQKAEQVMGEQASYMGKENLQRLIAKVTGHASPRQR